MPSSLSFSLKIILLISLGLIAGGCSDDDDDEAYIRVIHASPDILGIDGLIDSELEINNLRFTEISEWITESFDEDDTKSVPLVLQQSLSFGVISEDTVRLRGGEEWTALQLGFSDSPELILYREPEDGPDGGLARIRILHASAILQDDRLDVVVYPPLLDPANFIPTEDDLRFGVAPLAIDSEAGEFKISVYDSEGTNIIDTSRIYLFEEGNSYTILITDPLGTTSGDPFSGNLLFSVTED